MMHGDVVLPSLDEIARIARAEIAGIPEPFRSQFRNVIIRVDDFCDAETQREMGLASPFDLLGLYRGVPWGEKSIAATPSNVDMIFLYRRPILEYGRQTGDDLVDMVRHVLIHEIGHHMGLSDEDMHRIESQD